MHPYNCADLTKYPRNLPLNKKCASSALTFQLMFRSHPSKNIIFLQPNRCKMKIEPVTKLMEAFGALRDPGSFQSWWFKLEEMGGHPVVYVTVVQAIVFLPPFIPRLKVVDERICQQARHKHVWTEDHRSELANGNLQEPVKYNIALPPRLLFLQPCLRLSLHMHGYMFTLCVLCSCLSGLSVQIPVYLYAFLSPPVFRMFERYTRILSHLICIVNTTGWSHNIFRVGTTVLNEDI